MTKMKAIAEILPEGLSEDTITKIAEIVDKIISEAIEQRVQDLTVQTQAFLRMKIDELKEQAIKELELENETYRNAKLFEAVRGIMVTELTSDDEDSAITAMAEEVKSTEQDNEVLAEEVNKVLEHNQKLMTVVRALNDKVKNLEAENIELTEGRKEFKKQIKVLEESSQKPFKSSERAIVASKGSNHPTESHQNNFLTEEIMKLMPNKK